MAALAFPRMRIISSSLCHFIRWRNVGTVNHNDELEPLVARMLQVTSRGSGAGELSKIQSLSQLAYYLRDNPESCEAAIKQRILPVLLKLYSSEEQDVSSLARWALILLGYPISSLANGVRILSVDGGGVRGVIPVLMLQELERISERRVYELFDYVCGTSTGSLLLALSCIRKDSLDSVEHAYRHLSSEVFGTNTLVGMTKLFLTQAFYDTNRFENILRNEEGMDQYFIDTTMDPLVPKMSFISTIINQSVIEPFVFRNYRHSPVSNFKSCYQGCGEVRIWEAMRVSTAAPGYFEDMALASYVHQDGGLLVNNPTAIALHEAQRLWGNSVPIQCVISLGTGCYPRRQSDVVSNANRWRDKLLNVIASATDTEVVHTILSDLLPSSEYFRFNPPLSEPIAMDENRNEKLQLIIEETNLFIASQEKKFRSAVRRLVEHKTKLKSCQQWIKHYWDRFTN